MTDKSSHGTHFKVNHETDYTTHKAFPWHSSQSIQGDRLHQDGQNPPLESFLKHQETDYKYADKSSPGTPLKAPRDRLHQEHRSLLLAPLLAKYQETSYIDNKQVFSWSLFSEHQETDYTRNNDRQLSLPLGFLSEYTRGQANKHIQVFLWHLLQCTKGQTTRGH